MSKKIKQAVILAGGSGSRLRPLTLETPKPMIPVGGKLFLEYLLDLLKKSGVEEIVLLIGYLPHKFISYFGDGKKHGVKIKYSIDSEDTLNGSRIINAKHLLDDTFLLLYGDMYFSADVGKLLKFYGEKSKLITMVAYNNLKGDGEYGQRSNIKVDKNGLVTYYGNLEYHDVLGHDPNIHWLDVGFFVVNKESLKFAPKYNFEWQSHFLPRIIHKKELVAFKTQDSYCSLNTIELLKKAEKFFNDKKQR